LIFNLFFIQILFNLFLFLPCIKLKESYAGVLKKVPGYIPPETVNEIIQKADIVEVISKYLTLKKTGKNFVGLCPFHSEDTPSFSVAPDKQIFYCFGCQKGGNVLQFIMEMESITLPEAAEELAGQVGVSIPQQKLSPKEAARNAQKRDLLCIHELAADFFVRNLPQPAAAAYIKKRGISLDSLTGFRLGYAAGDDWEILYRYLSAKGFSDSLLEESGLVSHSAKTGHYYDKFHGRLMFPICDYRGQVVAFGGRVIGEGEPKYLNSPQSPIYNKSQHLYALHIAATAIRHQDLAVVMEGYMDVLTAHQYGVNNAVASLGTAFTEAQARLLKRYTTNVLLCYDSDEAGSKAAQRGLEVLREQGFTVRVIRLPGEKDPDDFLRRNGYEGWQLLIKKHTLDALEYLLQIALEKYGGNTATEKGRITSELLPAIAKTKSQVERESFIKMLAKRLGVSTETVYADLRKSGLKIALPQKESSLRIHSIQSNIVADPSALLLRLMLEDQDIFFQALEELGDDFCQREEEKQLISMIQDIQAEYDWHAVSLLHRFSGENEGLRKFVLKLLQIDLPQLTFDELANEYIQAFKIRKLQKRIQKLNEEIACGSGDIRQNLIELSKLQQDLQKSKEVRA